MSMKRWPFRLFYRSFDYQLKNAINPRLELNLIENYLPVEKSHTIRELFSIPVFPGDLWRNNP